MLYAPNTGPLYARAQDALVRAGVVDALCDVLDAVLPAAGNCYQPCLPDQARLWCLTNVNRLNVRMYVRWCRLTR